MGTKKAGTLAPVPLLPFLGYAWNLFGDGGVRRLTFCYNRYYANSWGAVHVLEQTRVRWYNPALEDFEWREVPQSDEEALSLLEGSSHTPRCTETYKEWRAKRRESPRRKAHPRTEVRDSKESRQS
jgi:hypothetical protein